MVFSSYYRFHFIDYANKREKAIYDVTLFQCMTSRGGSKKDDEINEW